MWKRSKQTLHHIKDFQWWSDQYEWKYFKKGFSPQLEQIFQSTAPMSAHWGVYFLRTELNCCSDIAQDWAKDLDMGRRHHTTSGAAGDSDLTWGILRNRWCLFCLFRTFLLSWMSSAVLKEFVDSYVLRLLTRLHLKDRALCCDLICTLSWYRWTIQARISQPPWKRYGRK